MTVDEKIDVIKSALAKANQDGLIDLMNDVKAWGEEAERRSEMVAEPALDESLEGWVQPSVIVQSVTVNVYLGDREKNK